MGSLSLKIAYCTVLTLLVVRWDDIMPMWWDEWGDDVGIVT